MLSGVYTYGIFILAAMGLSCHKYGNKWTSDGLLRPIPCESSSQTRSGKIGASLVWPGLAGP